MRPVGVRVRVWLIYISSSKTGLKWIFIGLGLGFSINQGGPL